MDNRKILWVFLVILLMIPLGTYAVKMYLIKPALPPSPLTSVTLKCPFISKWDCNNVKVTKFKGESALAYRVATGTAVLSGVTIEKKEDIDSFENFVLNIKSVHLANKLGDSCYKIIYTIPKDSIFFTPGEFPGKAGLAIARIGQEMIEGEDATLILTVKKMADTQNPCTIQGNPEVGTNYPIENIEIK